MNKETELILEELRIKKEELQEKAPKNIVIQNIKLLGTIQLNEIETDKEQEEVKTAKLYLVEEYNKETDKIMLKYYADDEFIGIENEGEFIPTGLAKEKYESTDSIKDVLENLEEKEEVQQGDSEKEKTQKVYDLNELEEEKQKEEKDKEEETSSSKDENKKRKPQRVLETVKPDSAKMDYWHTLRQVFGLPPQVAELAFAYPISSEDKVDYADITIYMLDKDGYIINDLDVDDYFKFDSATGNNPQKDEKAVHGKGEEHGQAQLEENNTMIRLKAVHPNAQPNTYISMEQIDGIGDYRDINVGRQTLHTTDYVEKQVVTHRVRRDFDSEAEELMKSNGGQYKLKDIYKEAEKHRDHDEKYVDITDADGEKETFSCVQEKDWKELATKWGYYKDGKPDEEKAKKIFEEFKENNPQLSDEEVVQEVSDDLYEQIPGRNLNR